MVLSIWNCWAQPRTTSIEPRVNVKFEYPFYKEGFDSISKDWPILSNAENLLLIQDGEYILQRKSKLSPFAAMGEFEKQPEAFRLVTSLKIVKNQADDASMGFIFMAQEGGKGGFVFEINKEQQYRLRQITSSGYAYLTGTSKDGGWTKSSLLKPVNFANLIELRTIDKVYDLYVNNTLLLSFSELAYKSGGIGFIIGPGTMGKVDFIYIFSNDKELASSDPSLENTEQPSGSDNDIIALAESIIELKSQINKIKSENESLKERIETFKGSEKEQLKMRGDYELKIAQLDKVIKSRDKSIDSLLLINQDLQKYKDLVKGNEGGDLVITLSKNLKAEKLKSDELVKQNQALRDSLQQIQTLNKNSTSKAPGGTSERPPGNKNNNTFVLPKEN